MSADARFWDGMAEKYSRMPVGNPQAFERKVAITRDQLTPQSIVLDIGCGTGSLALLLAPSAGHVHGLDVSSAMIQIARDRARAQQVDNVSFHVGAFDEGFSTVADGCVDLICAYSLLHLLDDPAAGLKRIQRLLRPGGTFVSSTVCLGESWMPYGPLLRVMRWVGKAPAVKMMTGRVLQQALRDAGFVDIEQPDVGAEKVVCFFVARKPATA